MAWEDGHARHAGILRVRAVCRELAVWITASDDADRLVGGALPTGTLANGNTPDRDNRKEPGQRRTH